MKNVERRFHDAGPSNDKSSEVNSHQRRGKRINYKELSTSGILSFINEERAADPAPLDKHRQPKYMKLSKENPIDDKHNDVPMNDVYEFTDSASTETNEQEIELCIKLTDIFKLNKKKNAVNKNQVKQKSRGVGPSKKQKPGKANNIEQEHHPMETELDSNCPSEINNSAGPSAGIPKANMKDPKIQLPYVVIERSRTVENRIEESCRIQDMAEISRCFDFNDEEETKPSPSESTNAMWRPELPILRNPHLLKYNPRNALPCSEQEPIINYDVAARLDRSRLNQSVAGTSGEANRGAVITEKVVAESSQSTSHHKRMRQQTLDDFLTKPKTVDSEDSWEYSRISLLFDDDLVTTSTTSTPNCTLTNDDTLPCISSTSTKQTRNVLTERIEPNVVHPQQEQDVLEETMTSEESSFAFFSDSNKENYPRAEVNRSLHHMDGSLNKPTRFDMKVYARQTSKVIRGQAKPAVEKVKQKETTLTNQELVLVLSDESNDEEDDKKGPKPHFRLFDDTDITQDNSLDESHPCHNQCSEGEEAAAMFGGPTHSRHGGERIKRKRKRSITENPEFLQWAEQMNQLFSEIDKHPLETE